MKQKEKRKKDLKGRPVMIIGNINHPQRANISFGNKRLKLKFIFQNNRDKNGWIH